MTDLDARLDALAQAIRDLGVNASTDVADLTPPAVLVGVDRVEFGTLNGDVMVTASIDVLAPDRTRGGTWREVGRVFDALTALPIEGVASIVNSAGQVIGWRATYPLD